MKRKILLSLLENYLPQDPLECRCKEEILAFILQNKDCFERSLTHGHITGSAWLVNADNTQALLLHHAKLDLWCQLGGHCDGESDVLAVALREAQEESGIDAITPFSTQIFDIDIHPIPAHKEVEKHVHYDIRFLLQVKSEEKAVGNFESKGLLWVSRDQKSLPSEEESILRMHRKWNEIPV